MFCYETRFSGNNDCRMNVRSKAPTTRIKGVITAHKQAGTGAANAVVKPYGKTLSPQVKRLHQLLFVLPMNKGELLHCYTYIYYITLLYRPANSLHLLSPGSMNGNLRHEFTEPICMLIPCHVCLQCAVISSTKDLWLWNMFT